MTEGTMDMRLPCSASTCLETAKLVCSRCHLVAYCTQACQKEHWLKHKSDCNHELSKETWRPGWHCDGRVPDFMSHVSSHGGYGFLEQSGQSLRAKYLWGNVPAYDILNLSSNEGENCERDLAVCFIASGDMRNALMTVSSLPSSFSKALRILVNDRDDDVTFRNILIRLILHECQTDLGIETAIHLWYSARITKAHRDVLQTCIRPLVADVVMKTKNKSGNILLSKRISSNQSTIRIMLYRGQWQKLLSRFDVLFDTDKTERNRKLVTLNRVDNFHRYVYQWREHLHQRVSCKQFRERGVLLPFGLYDDDFCETNPTLFSESGHWLQPDSADPLDGWDSLQAQSRSLRPLSQLSNDLYGNLFFYLKQLLRDFQMKTTRHKITFEISGVQARSVQTLVGLGSDFDRIDVSNIIDACYLDVDETLKIAQRFLNPWNPKSTLVSLFINAMRMVASTQQRENLAYRVRTAARFLGMDKSPPSRSHYDADMLRLMTASDLLMPVQDLFSEYIKSYLPSPNSSIHGLRMKKQHTIVPKWPFTLKKSYGQDGAQKEFDEQLKSPHSFERYVEWQLSEK